MSQLTLNQIQDLGRSGESEGPCLSLYLPIFTGRDASGTNQMRLENLVRRARELVAKHSLSKPQMEALMLPLERLVRASPFPQYRTNLAIFVSVEQYHEIQVPAYIPAIVHCGERFYLGRLIEACDQLHQYFAVVLTGGVVNLYSGGPLGLKSLPWPVSIRPSPLRLYPADKALGALVAPLKRSIRSGLRTVAEVVESLLNQQDSKLVTFGPSELTDHIHSRLGDRQTVQIEGDHGHLHPDLLHILAWPDVLLLAEQDRLKRITELENASPWGAVRGPEESLSAARRGDIARLFIRRNNRWREREIAEEAALETLRQGGEITVCDAGILPDSVAALLRVKG